MVRLYCLYFFDLRKIITPLVSSNFSYNIFYICIFLVVFQSLFSSRCISSIFTFFLLSSKVYFPLDVFRLFLHFSCCLPKVIFLKMYSVYYYIFSIAPLCSNQFYNKMATANPLMIITTIINVHDTNSELTP
jgi:hypothetical protein